MTPEETTYTTITKMIKQRWLRMFPPPWQRYYVFMNECDGKQIWLKKRKNRCTLHVASLSEEDLIGGKRPKSIIETTNPLAIGYVISIASLPEINLIIIDDLGNNKYIVRPYSN